MKAKIEKIYEVIAERTFHKTQTEMKPTWHSPVMIWDVLDWMQPKYWIWIPDLENRSEVCMKREHKRKPIEEQSEECIDFIYNLIK